MEREGDKVSKKLYLTYPAELAKKPVIWELGQKFKVITNIRSASLKGDIGLVALEIEGDEKEVERGVSWLKEIGINVQPIEQDIVEG